ncbi:MAG: DUF4402 domain-containing protein [Parasphingorhabdus sp.]|nr:DUF4402 domain-containing protein [Parasphingorhabdus sp.]
MTNKFATAAVAAAVLATGMFGATAASAATATADAKANILQQVTVTKTADLDFATIVSGAASSTVAVSPLGVRTCGVGLVCSGTATAAGFNITGTTGTTVTLASDANVTLNSGANSMVATLNTSSATHVLTGVALTDQFTVGGSLAVAANQADGNYAGTFNVTVNYQ